jgi:hypothetical protein
MRGTINERIKAFAEQHGYGFASDIVPTGLLNEKYPCIFCVAPDTTYNVVTRRWTYPTTIYLVAPIGKKRDANSILNDLQHLSRDLFLFLRQGCTLYTDKEMKIRPKAGFDNSGAVAVEMVVALYEADECND